MPVLHDLGKALCWLRLEADRKQNDLARAAGVTAGMLSSYERGKKIPTLTSLAKILDALDADLHQLADALDRVQGRPVRRREPPRQEDGEAAGDPPGAGQWMDLQRLRGGEEPLSCEEEAALRQLVESFVRWLRVLRRVGP